VLQCPNSRTHHLFPVPENHLLMSCLSQLWLLQQQTERLKQQKPTSHPSGGWEVQDQGEFLMKTLLLVCRRPSSRCIPTRWKRKSLCVSPHKGFNPIHEGSIFMTVHLPKFPPPNIIILEIRIPTREFWAIQSIVVYRNSEPTSLTFFYKIH